jgi:hypothetical protein
MADSVLALRVKSGRDGQQRLIPYGVQDWGLTHTQQWLDRAGIISGPVFVGMRKGDNFYLSNEGRRVRLSERSLEYVLQSYPISVDGELRTVTSHDLRRTYARQQYLAGTDLPTIQRNMGHQSQNITLSYIGTPDAQPPEPLWETLPLPSGLPVDIEADDSLALFDRFQMMPTPAPSGYVFKIVLFDIQPQIWRRFKLPAGISFHTLHNIIQVVMGWENYHLYRFDINGLGFIAQPMGWNDRSSNAPIDPHLMDLGQQFFYEYDFGDSWGHVLTLEKFLVREVTAPRCLAGTRACPPEDSGGPWLYDKFLRSRRSRKGRVSRKWQHRIGNYWDADAFDLAFINQNLASKWKQMQES